jgi:uncharacterized Tic20 family protein
MTPFRTETRLEPTMSDVPELPPATPSDSLVEIPSTSEDRTMAMVAHLGGGLFNFWVPLIIWLIKKDKSPFVDDQGKEALNFSLTMLIGHVLGGITICFTLGLLNMAVAVVSTVFGIIAGVEANKGKVYRYPINIRFIK